MTQSPAITAQTGLSSAWIHGEPGVAELIDDPLVWLVLRRDGLTKDDLRAALACGRTRLDPTSARAPVIQAA